MSSQKLAHQRRRAGEHTIPLLLEAAQPARAGRRRLFSKEQLYQLYEQATRDPYSFLFVYYLKSKKEMFYRRFEERFVIDQREV